MEDIFDELNESPLAIYHSYLKQGVLGYQVSESDSTPVFFPRVMAPRTGKTDLAWHVSSGIGTVHSTTVVYRRDQAPLNVALIELDDGFRMMSRVEGMEPESVQIGTRVRVRVLQESDPPYPVFDPTELDSQAELAS